MQIGVSRPAAVAMKDAIDRLYNEFYFTKKDDNAPEFRIPSADAQPIPSWSWSSIKSCLTTFEAVFNAELSEATAYFVPSKGIYSTAALVDKADQCFPSDIASEIPEKARADWRSAGRCLAFNLLTASGFHVARAVEATMEAYYMFHSGKTETLIGWEAYCRALEALPRNATDPAPSERTINEFRQMKDDFRNPIMHPRVSLNEGDAKILFNNGESLIILMASEIKELRSTKTRSLASP